MRSALIVWGGWNGHEPEECAAIYRRWLHEDGDEDSDECDIAYGLTEAEAREIAARLSGETLRAAA